MKKKNKSHPIPKKQQIHWTPDLQLVVTYLFLEEKAYKSIRDIIDGLTKRKLKEMDVDLKEIKVVEGQAVVRKVHRLFKGKYTSRGKVYTQLPLFNYMLDRTGHHVGRNEAQCIGIAIQAKRSIKMVSRLTGRDGEEVQELMGLNKNSLLDKRKKK